ncbi:MAG: DUF3526 domain-containing protein [Planctomycetes bacterium]|nr:DUF3526 domain-containing protein [Planctomycetota bacterium]
MIWTLFSNEWRATLRDGRGILVLAVGTVLAIASTWTTSSTLERERIAQEEATFAAREAWDARALDNPHARAHYGDYVFRPPGPLAELDPGVQSETGRVVYTEAHRQNSAVHKPQQESASLLRYDRLEPATVLQLLAPLVMVLAGFGVVSSERESGRLRLLWIQGVRPLPLLLAKSLALWSLGALVCLIVVAVHLAFSGPVEAGRTAVFIGLHLLVIWVVAVLVTCVSAQSRRPGTAAALLLSLWVIGAIVFPRVAAMSAHAIDPLPGRDAFQAAMQEDREQGMDGHNPRDTRRQAFERQVLEEYGVETPAELPINLGGLVMQADEEYGSQVWDKHFGELTEHLVRQSTFAGYFSLLNPLQAIDRASMAVAGTDLHSHLEFLRQVEDYRRVLVKRLNDEHAFGGSRTGQPARVASREFYESFQAFDFEPLSLRSLLGKSKIALFALLIWGLGSVGYLFFAARRMNRGGLL